MTFFRTLVLSSFLLLCSDASLAGALPSISESRQEEVHRIVLDLQNPAVVVFVAVRPGAEDFTGLASLRLARGAKVTTVFVTNGESVPNDAAGENQRHTAGRRKEEAYECATSLGTQAFFLNLPDPGVLNDRQALNELWNKDTLSHRLSAILEAIHPDFIFLTGDRMLGNSSSASMRILRETLIELAGAKPSATKAAKEPGKVSPIHLAGRVFVDDGSASQKFGFDGSVKPKFFNQTAAQIGARAAAQYRSYQALWPKLINGVRKYTLVYPRIAPLPSSYDSGVAFVPPGLKGLSDEIIRVTGGLDGRGSGDKSILLEALVARVDSVVRTAGGRLSAHDLGIIARWKNGLEELRCALMGVHCDFELLDSLVTDNQVFELKINSFRPMPKTGATSIYIPKSSNIEWIVNESLSKSFPFDGPAEYRILTPDKLLKNTPSFSYGLTASRMRTNFLFMIVHRDSIPSRSFYYKKEVPLRIGPVQSFDVANDVMVASDNDPLAIRILNISRDAIGGTFSVHDSVVQGGPTAVRVEGKTELVDTLQLEWKEGLPFGEYTAGVWTSKKQVGRFMGRKFPCEVNSPGSLGIVSSIPHSSIERAVRSLGMTPNLLTAGADGARSLSEMQTVIIDRDAFAVDRTTAMLERDLWQWVSDGGRLILLSQFHAHVPPFGDRPIPRFEEGLATQSGAEVSVDTSSSLAYIPNRLNMDDWGGWEFARAYGSLNVSGTSSEVLVRAKDTGSPLLTTTRVGKGMIVCVALNIDAQLTNVVPGAYRLLANIVGAK